MPHDMPMVLIRPLSHPLAPFRTSGGVSAHSAADLSARLFAAVLAKRVQYGHLPKVQIVFVGASGPARHAFAEYDPDAFEAGIGDLIDKSISSISGGVGVVRVSLRVGLRSVSVAVEDNGRGFSDDLIRRSLRRALGGPETPDELAPSTHSIYAVERMRRLAHDWGGRSESVSRLGAGSRTDVELPRADDLGCAAAAQARQS